MDNDTKFELKNQQLAKRVNILNCPVDQISMQEALEWIYEGVKNHSPKYISVLNANKLYLMAKHPELDQIIKNSDLIIPEWAVVWGAKQLKLQHLSHVGGIMLLKALLPYAQERGLSMYLLGARPEVVSCLAEKLRIEYPGLKIVGYHHGYLTSQDIESETFKDIRQSKPDVLFVAMGSPSQEYWIKANYSQLNIPVSIGVGGSFDVLSGIKKDTPDWARGNGLEWLYRLFQAPRQYWRRYMVTNIWFVWQIIKSAGRRYK